MLLLLLLRWSKYVCCCLWCSLWWYIYLLHCTLKTQTADNVYNLIHSKKEFQTETRIQTVDASTQQNTVWIWVSVFNFFFEWMRLYTLSTVWVFKCAVQYIVITKDFFIVMFLGPWRHYSSTICHYNTFCYIIKTSHVSVAVVPSIGAKCWVKILNYLITLMMKIIQNSNLSVTDYLN